MPPTLAEAVSFASSRLEQGAPPVAGRFTCPVAKLRARPAYPLWAQIHQNRIAGLLLQPDVMRSLEMICILASAVDGGGQGYSRRPMQDALITGGPCVTHSTRSCSFALPRVLERIRGTAPRLRLVLYHNPRGSDPHGTDSCASLQVVDASRRSNEDSYSWHAAGTLVQAVQDASSRSTLLMDPGHNLQSRAPYGGCVLVASRPSTEASCPSSSSHGANGGGMAYRSYARVGSEHIVEVLAVHKTAEHGGRCELTVRWATPSPPRIAAGTTLYAPTLIDAGASTATCKHPPQHAFDYGSAAAAACIETYLRRDVAIGAHGSWLDNMGANVYGAMTPTGHELRSFQLHLRSRSHRASGAQSHVHHDGSIACAHERAAAVPRNNEHAASAAIAYSSVLSYKDCAFSFVAQQQANRTAVAIRLASAALGTRPAVYGNGLKHSFYWTASEMASTRAALDRHLGRPGRPSAARDESPPFAPDPSDRVVFFAVEGTKSLMAGGTKRVAALDGFNMESFFGFIESKAEVGARACNRWPTHNRSSLESCGFTFHFPGSPFWHANVRVFAHAARHGLRALAKIGQAGWKTFAQELLPPARLHKWWLAAYCSFLLAVAGAGENSSIALGVHPFARRPDGRTVPWLHPAVYLDIGRPLDAHALIEAHRPSGHTSYVRRFERAVIAYNPEADADAQVPLGGEYVDPWGDHGCRRLTHLPLLRPHEGMLLVAPSLVRGHNAADRPSGRAQQHGAGRHNRRRRLGKSRSRLLS